MSLSFDDIADDVAAIEMLLAAGAFQAAADYVSGSRYPVALSHEIEDRAEDGTVWARLFDILCGD